MAFTYTLGGKTVGGTPSGPTVSIGGKQVPVTTVSKTSSIGRSMSGGSASFGGGLPSTKSKVGGISTVLQQQAAAKRAEIIRAADLRARTQQLKDRDASLGQEKLQLASQKKVLDALQARINEAAKKPFTTEPYYNKLIRDYENKSKAFENKTGTYNSLVSNRNARARGLAEQFQVEQAKEMREYNPDVSLKRTSGGTLYSKFRSGGIAEVKPTQKSYGTLGRSPKPGEIKTGTPLKTGKEIYEQAERSALLPQHPLVTKLKTERIATLSKLEFAEAKRLEEKVPMVSSITGLVNPVRKIGSEPEYVSSFPAEPYTIARHTTESAGASAAIMGGLGLLGGPVGVTGGAITGATWGTVYGLGSYGVGAATEWGIDMAKGFGYDPLKPTKEGAESFVKGKSVLGTKSLYEDFVSGSYGQRVGKRGKRAAAETASVIGGTILALKFPGSRVSSAISSKVLSFGSVTPGVTKGVPEMELITDFTKPATLKQLQATTKLKGGKPIYTYRTGHSTLEEMFPSKAKSLFLRLQGKSTNEILLKGADPSKTAGWRKSAEWTPTFFSIEPSTTPTLSLQKTAVKTLKKTKWGTIDLTTVKLPTRTTAEKFTSKWLQQSDDLALHGSRNLYAQKGIKFPSSKDFDFKILLKGSEVSQAEQIGMKKAEEFGLGIYGKGNFTTFWSKSKKISGVVSKGKGVAQFHPIPEGSIPIRTTGKGVKLESLEENLRFFWENAQAGLPRAAQKDLPKLKQFVELQKGMKVPSIFKETKPGEKVLVYGGYLGIGKGGSESSKTLNLLPKSKKFIYSTKVPIIETPRLKGETLGDWQKRWMLKSGKTQIDISNILGTSTEGQVTVATSYAPSWAKEGLPGTMMKKITSPGFTFFTEKIPPPSIIAKSKRLSTLWEKIPIVSKRQHLVNLFEVELLPVAGKGATKAVVKSIVKKTKVFDVGKYTSSYSPSYSRSALELGSQFGFGLSKFASPTSKTAYFGLLPSYGTSYAKSFVSSLISSPSKSKFASLISYPSKLKYKSSYSSPSASKSIYRSPSRSVYKSPSQSKYPSSSKIVYSSKSASKSKYKSPYPSPYTSYYSSPSKSKYPSKSSYGSSYPSPYPSKYYSGLSYSSGGGSPVPSGGKYRRGTGKFGYKVFVRGKGKKTAKGFKSGEFIQATTGVLSRKEAMAFGQSLVAGTAKRTFKLVPAVGQRAKVKRLPKFRPEMFRTKGRTFVEKTKFAIDTSGERRSITQAGLQKLRFSPKLRKRKVIRKKKLKKQSKKKRRKKK